ncbi:MAG: hypothetical protein ACK517_04115, partial [bacterium]
RRGPARSKYSFSPKFHQEKPYVRHLVWVTADAMWFASLLRQVDLALPHGESFFVTIPQSLHCDIDGLS